jgi:DNA polymerase-1
MVGIAPGSDEIRTGIPFIGQSGKILNSILSQVGYPRERVYTTNLVCVYNNNPTPELINACSQRLHRELQALQPRLIVTLGKLPSEYFGGRQFGKLQSAVLWNKLHNCWHLSTFHPAASLHGDPSLINNTIRDLAKIPQILQWPDTFGQVQHQVITDPIKAQQILDGLPRNECVALDIETSNKDDSVLDSFVDKLLCVGIGLEPKDGAIDAFVFPAEICTMLVWPTDVKWVYHNALFDMQGMRRYLKVWLPCAEDTMLQSYSLDERKIGIHKLKPLTREYCGATFYEEHKHDDLEHLYEYNAKDAAYTARLAPMFKTMQQADNVRGMYESLLLPAVNVFARMQFRGVRVDLEKLRELANDWVPRWGQQREALCKQANEFGWVGEINTNSPLQLSKLLYQMIGLPGGPSTDKEHLEVLRVSHPFVEDLLNWRRLDHMLNTYVVGVQDDIKRDLRVHAEVQLHGTVTGRLSYRNPPLQTIPQPYQVGTDYGRVRHLFIPVSKDSVIVDVDYEKAEVWGAYIYSGDPQLYKDLTSGDYHGQVVQNVFRVKQSNVSYDEWKELRRKSKYVTFGIMYGRQARDLAEGELKCTVSEAQLYLDEWRERYPTYMKWVQSVKDTLDRNGEVVSLTGRKRRIRIVTQEQRFTAYNQAVNFPIQALASDCLLSSTIELYPLLRELKAHILICIHDGMAVEVPKVVLEPSLELIHKVMTAPRFPGCVSIPIEVTVGPRWGMGTEVKREGSKWNLQDLKIS